MVETPTDNPLEAAGDTASELLTDFVTGLPIPAPVKKNLFKAFARLCSATIDVPVAYLEGKADESRAETRARIKLINTTADQISEQMRVDPVYARRAVEKFGHRVLREQVNLDMIAEKSVEELKSRPEFEDTSEAGIDDDWLNEFETEARKKSTEEMQTYFARVLSGEIVRPGSFSLRAIKILGSLDVRVAHLFQRLCSLSVLQEASRDMRVLSLDGNAGDNALAAYGLDFGALNVLNEYGLIIADYHSWRDYRVCAGMTIPGDGGVDRVIRLPFVYQDRQWVLVPKATQVATGELKLHGVALTNAALELAAVVVPDPLSGYTKALAEFFQARGLDMMEVRTRSSLESDAGEEK